MTTYNFYFPKDGEGPLQNYWYKRYSTSSQFMLFLNGAYGLTYASDNTESYDGRIFGYTFVQFFARESIYFAFDTELAGRSNRESKITITAQHVDSLGKPLKSHYLGEYSIMDHLTLTAICDDGLITGMVDSLFEGTTNISQWDTKIDPMYTYREYPQLWNPPPRSTSLTITEQTL